VNEALGLFVPGRGPLYRIHPVPKLLLALWGVIAPFVVAPGLLTPFLAVVVVGTVILLPEAAYIRRVLLTTIPIVASILLVNGFFFPGARDVLLELGPFRLTEEGLAFGLPIAARVVIAVAFTVALVTTTRPDDLMEALVQRGAPVALAFVVLNAIQTIPRMQDSARRILEAQQARALRTGGGVRARVRALVPLVGPLVIRSLVDAHERALALEARAFRSSATRTAYRVIALRRLDRALIVVGVVALLALPVIAVARVLRIA
jgi:energy-coupling factor transport system permease protein